MAVNELPLQKKKKNNMRKQEEKKKKKNKTKKKKKKKKKKKNTHKKGQVWAEIGLQAPSSNTHLTERDSIHQISKGGSRGRKKRTKTLPPVFRLPRLPPGRSGSCVERTRSVQHTSTLGSERRRGPRKLPRPWDGAAERNKNETHNCPTKGRTNERGRAQKKEPRPCRIYGQQKVLTRYNNCGPDL